MTDLTGQVALVTGSGRGIGKAIAERYASLGANVVVNYARGKSGADETVARIEELGAKAIAVPADMSQVDDVTRLFDTALSAFGQIDIVVVNAGLELTGLPVVDFTEEQFDRMFATNTKGAFFTMQSAAKHVADNGRIIYISSSTTGYPQAGYALHGGSKTAPQYLVEVLAHEVGARGVTVNAILPTATDGAGPAHRRPGRRTDQDVRPGLQPDAPHGYPGRCRRCRRVLRRRPLVVRQRSATARQRWRARLNWTQPESRGAGLSGCCEDWSTLRAEATHRMGRRRLGG